MVYTRGNPREVYKNNEKENTNWPTCCSKFDGPQRPEIEVIKAKLLVSKRPLNKAVTSKYDEIITTLEIAVS